MASAAQITANRLNAQHSTGPRTPEGKQRSSQNALKSGYCSTRLVIAPERQAEFDAYSTQFFSEIAPQGILELEFFHRLLVHGWNLRRIRDDETALTEAERDEANSHKLLLLGRYRHSLERSYERAMKALRELQTDRMQRSRYKPEPDDPFLTEFPLASPFVLPDPVDVATADRVAEILAEPLPHLPPLPAPWERMAKTPAVPFRKEPATHVNKPRASAS